MKQKNQKDKSRVETVEREVKWMLDIKIQQK